MGIVMLKGHHEHDNGMMLFFFHLLLFLCYHWWISDQRAWSKSQIKLYLHPEVPLHFETSVGITLQLARH